MRVKKIMKNIRMTARFTSVPIDDNKAGGASGWAS